MRKSAGDGITALDIKIGQFITLPGQGALAQVIFNVQNRFPASRPWATWAVGDLTQLTPSYAGLSERDHDNYLRHMDSLGVAVFLEIFPFKAHAGKGRVASDIPGMIDQWLGKFKHHPCIVGMGIDLEYLGKATDSMAQSWDEKIKVHHPSYRLFLRHYQAEYMPPQYRGKGDLLFINDASEGAITDLNAGFAAWANRFAPTACAFQIGYPADEDGMDGHHATGWWKLQDPIRDWGNAILPLIKDTRQELGLIWVTALSGKTYHQQWDLTRGARLPGRK
ncbi:hypothetical protein CK934_09710 [Chitinophaga sp. MD30]|nr:hypothetical protein CK934_09710 [Chitinophaga sp. MD30]